ncbi:PAS domain-containing sensor histidine kinase [Hymenobacter arizonensis]|uniref:histidine kinase n=1 Tax=Hymenobacter arizonensis TaxID=1227077 RepID=A0A1I5XI22_HYMAR|nr:PAS domain-containing protein [Hymenobacter arizonensis]SFQ31612.1 Signal transduction histidine kinase [Hymenobacter arizonensis]
MLPSAAAAIAPADDLLRELLAVSLTGVILYTPIYDPSGSGEVVDFAFEYLNPAAQRMLNMPEVPTQTHSEQWPHSKAYGTLAFHIDAFESGEPREYSTNYQADGYDNYYRLAARRAGTGLLVSFTDTTDYPRSAVEIDLREAQAAEKAAREDAEAQRQRLYQMLMHLPAQVATYAGPEHVYTLVNQRYQDYFPDRALLGRPVQEAMPEVGGQGFFERLDHVYATGEPAYGQEVPVHFDPAHPDRPGTVHINSFYLPLYDAEGRVDGVLDFSYDVTEQVLARQQLQELNQDLEARVQARTREAEAARAEAEEQRNRLLRLFQQAPALINIFTGPDHVLTLAHPGTAQMLQGRPLLGLPRRQALPELPEEQHAAIDHVYRSGEALHQQERLTRLDLLANGELHDVYLDLSYQPLFDATGQIEGVMSFAVDVTERVQARRRADSLQAEVLAATQRQVQEREAFQAVFEQTPALIALLRAPHHRFEYANPAYQQLFPGRQLVGLHLAEAVPELQEQGFVAILDRVYQTGETFFGAEVLFTVVAQNGDAPQTGYYNFTYQAYREAGQIAGISIFAYNVTERVVARQERAFQQQRLEQLFMQAPAAVCILAGPDMVYELVNPSYQALFPGRHLHGRPLLEALPEISEHVVSRTFRQVYETGATHEETSMLIPLVQPDGVLVDRYFNYIQQARYNEQGAIDGILVFAFEVTDQVLARQQAQAMAAELTAANARLVRTNVDLDNFIYTASHDLKAPISNIEGLLYLLQEELPAAVIEDANADVGPTLTRMLESVERFKRTIDHLTEVSKLQKEHSPATAAVNLHNVVEDVRQDLRPLLLQSGARLVVDVKDLPPILFSEKNLRSIVYNLLSNALKYRHPDRTLHVDVRAHVRAGYTVLEVHDNGLGIAAGHLPRLFTMFQRFHDHVEGTGIGLYMVKRMVENAGGRIEVHSQLGAGTTFFVYLPHAASPA